MKDNSVTLYCLYIVAKVSDKSVNAGFTLNTNVRRKRQGLHNPVLHSYVGIIMIDVIDVMDTT